MTRTDDNSGFPTVLTTPRVGKDRRHLLLPPVQAWINDDSKAKLCVKSRRVGLTYAEAYDAVSSRKTGRRKYDYWYTCTDKDSAREFIDYCAFFLGIRDAITEALIPYDTPDGERECWSFIIRPTDDTKIVAMPSRPAALRGKSGDVGADEWAFHLQAAELYKAAKSVTKWGGSFRGWSSQGVETTLFNVLNQNCRRVLTAMGHDPDKSGGDMPFDEMRKKARELRVQPVFSYHFINIFRAIEAGLVRLLNEVTGSTYTDESFLQECQEECLDQDHFNQEYGGIAASAAGQWLSLMLIAANESAEAAYPNAGLVGYQGGPCYVGVDFARNGDYTVIWVLERVGDVFWTRQIQYLHDMTTPDQADVLAAILNSVNFIACTHDSTGNGLGLFEYTQKRFGGRIHGVNFSTSVPVGKKTQEGQKELTVSVRESMATALKTVMEENKTRIPASDMRVRNELMKLKGAYLASGRLTFSAARDQFGHADHFWALAMAVSSAISTHVVPFTFKATGERAFRPPPINGGILV